MTRLLTILAVLAMLVVAGCGGEDEPTIPREEADQLVDLLRQARVQAGDQDRCEKLDDLVSQIRAEVEDLPGSVDRDTRRSLRTGVSNLEDKAREECEGAEDEETETETTPTETAPPPTETETVPPPTETETVPPPTETETEPPPPPPEEVPEPEVPGTGGAPPGQEKKDKSGKKDRDDG